MTESELRQKIASVERAIANYEELDCDMENPEYVARGNGFCDSKYSEDFIEGQLEKLRKEKEELEKAINNLKSKQ